MLQFKDPIYIEVEDNFKAIFGLNNAPKVGPIRSKIGQQGPK